MTIERKKQTCFVVMPFGEKTDAKGEEIDFDDIYRFFLKKTIESLGLECIRCDEVAESGSIHENMFKFIFYSDVVLVDITTANPNVFYELGVRHALTKAVTVLIRRKGTGIPFNIQGLQVVEYDQMKFASIERAKERIHEIIKRGLKTRKNDSPVHSALKLNILGINKPIAETRKIVYPLKHNDKKRPQQEIALVTGDIQNVKDIAIWVNSENINMQMARPMDGSISGIIRNLGAKKHNGRVVVDTIADALKEAMGNMDSIPPGNIIVTTSGSLEETHGVKKIFHAAAVIGQIGKGYFPITDMASCVTNALREADNLEETPVKESPNIPDGSSDAQLAESGNGILDSILFPLMGTRAANSDFEERLSSLLEASVEYLCANSDSNIKRVYFLNYSEKELEACQRYLDANPKLGIPYEETHEDDTSTSKDENASAESKPATEQNPSGDTANQARELPENTNTKPEGILETESPQETLAPIPQNQ